MMVGAVSAIEVVRSWSMIKFAKAKCNRSAESAEQEGIAAPNATADFDLPAAANELSEAVSQDSDEEPAAMAAVK